MIRALLAAIALLALIVPASADWRSPDAVLTGANEDLRRAESLWQQLGDRSEQPQSTQQRSADTGGDVIHPPANIDPKMTVVPPKAHGTMRVIPPPGSPRGNQNATPK